MIARLSVGVTLALCAAVLTGTLTLAGQLSPKPVLPASRTIEDLKTAYKGETTAHAKYAAYALKAQEEGFKGAATLFRAAAEAERIHARNHRAVLVKLGVQPIPGVYRGTPGSTAVNLRDAIKGESYERDTMYPEMIQHATAEGQPEAVRSLTYALNAETQHAMLYRQALANLRRGGPATVYYVAPTCGATYANAPPASCPTCGIPGSQFKRFR